VLPSKQSLLKPTQNKTTARAIGSTIDVKRVAQATGVLVIGVALAIWGIAVTFTPGPVTKLQVVPPYVDAGPPAPAKLPQRAAPPRTESSARDAAPARNVVPAYTPPPNVQPPPRPEGSVVPLAPVARTPRETRLAPPELRFEAFEEVSDSAIYSSDDLSVEPPVVQFPQQLGRVPLGVRREELTYVEVIINEDGRVMQVKAKESPRTIDESMVITMSLSAAKSWRFQPAHKDGKPVKFRQTLPVSLR
jgi:hypothetical protein